MSVENSNNYEDKNVATVEVDSIQIYDPILLRIVGNIINLLIHILSGITIFMCSWYASLTEPMSAYKLHIILCVLGYQFFMVQGVLVLSKYSHWADLLTYNKKRYVHWGLQICGLILVTVGSAYMMITKVKNFNTIHGILGLISLLVSFLSLMTGILNTFARKIRGYFNVKFIKFSHFITGGMTLILSSICLNMEYKTFGFRIWSSDSISTALIVISTMTSVLVACDRLLVMLRNKITAP